MLIEEQLKKTSPESNPTGKTPDIPSMTTECAGGEVELHKKSHHYT